MLPVYIVDMDHLKDLLAFPDRLREMLELLEMNKHRLRSDMTSGMAASGGYNKAHANAAVQLSRAMKDLGMEMRAWLDKVEQKTATLGQARKIELLCRFVRSLPVGERRKIYTEFVNYEAKWPQGVPLSMENENADTESDSEGCELDSGDLDRNIPDEQVCGSDSEQQVRGNHE